MAWARDRYACVIFNLHTPHDPEGIAGSAAAFGRLMISPSPSVAATTSPTTASQRPRSCRRAIRRHVHSGPEAGAGSRGTVPE